MKLSPTILIIGGLVLIVALPCLTVLGSVYLVTELIINTFKLIKKGKIEKVEKPDKKFNLDDVLPIVLKNRNGKL